MSVWALDFHDKPIYTLPQRNLNDPPLEGTHMSTHYPNAEISDRMDRCAHLIQGGTPVAEAMREAGYREAFIEAEADTFVVTYLAPKGVKVTGGRGRGKGSAADAGTAEPAA
jgi:hypothetical protein